MLIDNIFNKGFLKSAPELQYALGKNMKYREEVNNWLEFFNLKGWLTNRLKDRLKSGKTWTSHYSKINELRVAYFFEKKLKFNISQYETSTIGDKNVDFKGKIKDKDIFIEVKTPLDLYKRKGGWFDSSAKVLDLLDRANKQLPEDAPAIVVLSDDLEVTLFADIKARNSIINDFSHHPKITT